MYARISPSSDDRLPGTWLDSKVNTEQKSSESFASITGLRRPEPTLPDATVNTTFDFEEGLHTQMQLLGTFAV